MEEARMTADIPAGPIGESSSKEPSLTIQAVPQTRPSTRFRQLLEGSSYGPSKVVGSSTAVLKLSAKFSHFTVSSKNGKISTGGRI